jgi:cytoskeleton protein RodZ
VTAAQEQLPNDVTGPAGAGARLRAAREAAGLSLDQVAQQLKLAPRQVKALEDESFGELPGRTFSRGFVRNYARLLHLDAQDLLAHLPDVSQAPALESPTLHSTATRMAELPSATAPKTGLGRWLIPLILIGCIVAAAAYEWYRGGLSNNAEPARTVSDATDHRAPATSATVTSATVTSATATSASGVALPNPLASSSPTAPSQTVAPQSEAPQSASPAASMGNSVATPAGGLASVAPADAAVLLTYKGPSWTEIRDRSGQLVVSRLVAAGSVEPVNGAPPFDIVIGNAHVVTLVYRGKSVDLSPYTRRNIARLTLQ